MHGVSVTQNAVGFSCSGRRGMSGRLSLIAAAEAHVVWKNRLGHHVQGVSPEPLGKALLGQDGICQLGSLIDGAAFADFRDVEEYRQLKAAHEQFHQLGTEIVEKLKRGDRDGARVLFENDYSLALLDILQSLSIINRMLLE